MTLASWIILGVATVLGLWALAGSRSAERIRLRTAAILVFIVLIVELSG